MESIRLCEIIMCVKTTSYWFILWPINLKHTAINFTARIKMHWLTPAQQDPFSLIRISDALCVHPQQWFRQCRSKTVPVNPISVHREVIYETAEGKLSWLQFLFWRALYLTCKCDHLPGHLSFIFPLFGWHCAVFQYCLAADREITPSLVRFLTGAACQSVVLKPP